MTAAGHAVLQDDLRHRLRITRPNLAQRIQQAIADDANLVENAEFQAAQAEQELNEARIAELEDKLARAEIVDVSKLSGDTIKFGATVMLIDEDTGERRTWQIVGEPEANASEGKISVTSPMARALIGNARGATVLVEAPSGGRPTGSSKWSGRGQPKEAATKPRDRRGHETRQIASKAASENRKG
jgi:transcription elongation factor GreA